MANKLEAQVPICNPDVVSRNAAAGQGCEMIWCDLMFDTVRPIFAAPGDKYYEPTHLSRSCNKSLNVQGGLMKTMCSLATETNTEMTQSLK